MNIFLGFLLLVLCLFIGYICSGKYSLRKEFYYQFNEFNLKLKDEVSFYQRSIVKIVNEISVESDFYDCVKMFVLNKKFVFEREYLSAEEKEFLFKYLKKIGKSDKKTQIEYLQATGKIITEKYDKYSLEEKRYKQLCIKLGFLIGLIAFIVVL